MATERIRYVDTGSAGGNGTTAALSGTNAAYASLAAMLTGEVANLVSADVWLHVYFAATGDVADTTQISFNGFTTDLTRYILLEAAAGERATASGWKTDRYRLSVTNPAQGFLMGMQDNNVRFDGFQIEMLAAANWVSVIYHAGNTGLVFSNCRIRFGCTYAGGGYNVIGYQPNVSTDRCVFWNCIIEKHPSHVGTNLGKAINGGSGDTQFYNCIVYGGAAFYRGISAGDANVDVYDSVVFNHVANEDFYAITNDGTIDYCASDDNHGTHNVAEGTPGGAAWPNIFEDAANGDFRLKSGVALIGAGGMAGASLFSTDMDGTTRGAAWDVGAYEYVAGGAALLKIINE